MGPWAHRLCREPECPHRKPTLCSVRISGSAEMLFPAAVSLSPKAFPGVANPGSCLIHVPLLVCTHPWPTLSAENMSGFHPAGLGSSMEFPWPPEQCTEPQSPRFLHLSSGAPRPQLPFCVPSPNTHPRNQLQGISGNVHMDLGLPSPFDR